MAKVTQHTIEHVTYGSKGRRWEFDVTNKDGKQVYSYGTPFLRGGAVTAAKVANILNGSIKRSNDVDNLARANMATIFHKAAQLHNRSVERAHQLV